MRLWKGVLFDKLLINNRFSIYTGSSGPQIEHADRSIRKLDLAPNWPVDAVLICRLRITPCYDPSCAAIRAGYRKAIFSSKGRPHVIAAPTRNRAILCGEGEIRHIL